MMLHTRSVCLQRGIVAAAAALAMASGPAFAQAAKAAPGRVVAQAASASAPATPAVAAPLNLAQVYRFANENDATIRAARAGADARRERLPQARAQLLPNVSAAMTRMKNNVESTQEGVGSTTSRYVSSSRTLTLRQPLYRPAVMADYRQARAMVDEANATLEREMQTLAVRVTTAYVQTLAAEDQLALVVSQKGAYATHVDAARKRFAGGAGTRTDIDEAQARLDMVVAQELEARQNLGYTRQQLTALAGHPVERIAPLDQTRLPLTPPQPEQVEAWIARAEQNSPEIRALQAQVEAARQEVAKARSGHLPTLDAVAQMAVSDSDNVTRIDTRYDQRAVGLQLNVPIFAGGYVNSQVRQALAEVDRAEQSLEALRRDLGLRVHKEYRGVSEGVLRVRALEQAVRSAETVVASTRRSYQGGVRTQLDVLNAEEQLASALRNLAEARYNYLLARIQLRALSGEADLATVDEVNGWLRP